MIKTIAKIYYLIALISLTTLTSCTAITDYKTILKDANQAIDNLDNLGRREIELDYKAKGLILLRGQVATKEASQRIEQAVLSVKNVTHVENQLTIVPETPSIIFTPPAKPLPPTDQDIGSLIRSALAASDGFNLNSLEYKVENGLVTLTGDQPSFRAVDKILSVILMIDGVTDVTNNMTVKGTAYPLQSIK